LTDMSDPFQGFLYDVTLDNGSPTFGFQRVSGLYSLGRAEKRWEEITETYSPIKLPGVLECGDIVFSHGVYIKGTICDQWFNDVTLNLKSGATTNQDNQIRVTLNVIARGKGYKQGEGIRYRIYNAYPKAVRLSDFNAMSQEILVQQLVVACEGIVPIYASVDVSESQQYYNEGMSLA